MRTENLICGQRINGQWMKAEVIEQGLRGARRYKCCGVESPFLQNVQELRGWLSGLAGSGGSPPPSEPLRPHVITITMEGGVIQDIEDIPVGIAIQIVDLDVDDDEKPENITELPDGTKAVVTKYNH